MSLDGRNHGGLGDIVAGGLRRAAGKIGSGAGRSVIGIKGQEPPMHAPRGRVGLGIDYATSAVGIDSQALQKYYLPAPLLGRRTLAL